MSAQGQYRGDDLPAVRTLFAEIRWRKYAGHWMTFCHLLEYLYEEADLDLSGLLQQCIQGGCPFCFAQNLEPLLYGGKLILEILIQRSSSHLFQRDLILIDVSDPLLRGFVHDIIVVTLAVGVLRLIIIDFGCRSHTPA